MQRLRPTKPGIYSVSNNGYWAGFHTVEFAGHASGLLCKSLQCGGSIHCPGYSDWSRYNWDFEKELD